MHISLQCVNMGSSYSCSAWQCICFSGFDPEGAGRRREREGGKRKGGRGRGGEGRRRERAEGREMEEGSKEGVYMYFLIILIFVI